MRECCSSTTRPRPSSRLRSPGSENMSGRGTMTSRTVMLSSSSAWWIISSWKGGIWPNWRLAVTISLSSSGECTGPCRALCGAEHPQARCRLHGSSRTIKRPAEGEEDVHGRSHRQSDLFGALQRQRLGTSSPRMTCRNVISAKATTTGGRGNKPSAWGIWPNQRSTIWASSGSPTQPRVRLTMVIPNWTPLTTSSRLRCSFGQYGRRCAELR